MESTLTHPSVRNKQAKVDKRLFVTIELKEREKDVLTAESRQIVREKFLYDQLKSTIRKFVSDIRSVSKALSHLDVYCSFAELSENHGFVRPKLDNSQDLVVDSGKHPVLIGILGAQFVPNSLSLKNSGSRFLIITGPNMGGKSTYLRQAALIVLYALTLLAQNSPAAP